MHHNALVCSRTLHMHEDRRTQPNPRMHTWCLRMQNISIDQTCLQSSVRIAFDVLPCKGAVKSLQLLSRLLHSMYGGIARTGTDDLHDQD